ncbi:ABC transporter permease subunit [Pyrobaculum sp. 3827-6]|uniref:ABC transporter permease subunit n=1 Tax=Pyrobaculum sp. 3827-6 TaxID=2983604 RepID=UPI0021DB5995|nr:ABC transporter permease subunit [Pyrobaculum sp. 3827-6]MCU7788641.1 ABC transporter permease subunit [Pyrobaculum sp. 3827-6]
MAWSVALAFLALLATFGRMAAALLVTVAVAYAVAYAMYRSRCVESFMLPVLDVLQSVPILGFFPVALYVFIYVFPLAGAEVAAVFLIFTSMAWNIIFSVYQSFKTLPGEYLEMARLYLNERLELGHVLVPAALRGIYYNIPVSWANAFFFITASEVITLGTEVKLFGIGSLVVESFDRGDYQTAYVGIALGVLGNVALYLTLWRRLTREVPQPPGAVAEALGAWLKYGWHVVVALAAALLLAAVYYGVGTSPSLPQLAEFLRGVAVSAAEAPLTLLRVLAVMALSGAAGLAALYIVVRNPGWETAVLLGVSLLSSVPAVFLYPLLGALVRGEALAVLLLLPGAVVYAVLNTVAAWRDVPQDLARAYGIGGRAYLLNILIPASLPYLITGLLTTWGGAWNASIVAEPLAGVHGLGSLMAKAADRGDMPILLASVAVMTGVVVAVNKYLWKRLYERAARWR